VIGQEGEDLCGFVQNLVFPDAGDDNLFVAVRDIKIDDTERDTSVVAYQEGVQGVLSWDGL